MAERAPSKIVEMRRAALSATRRARRQSLTDVAVGLLLGALIIGAAIGTLLIAESAGLTEGWQYLVAGIAAIAAVHIINRATRH